ncbi:hypothetical protein [Amycolatopsis sp. NPDC051903]|uniref:hypothetical protein n=1 Tax=Amycolatopsis sp. NPDC051903 TaxID=3363936 RepID=UPI0037A1116E
MGLVLLVVLGSVPIFESAFVPVFRSELVLGSALPFGPTLPPWFGSLPMSVVVPVLIAGDEDGIRSGSVPVFESVFAPILRSVLALESIFEVVSGSMFVPVLALVSGSTAVLVLGFALVLRSTFELVFVSLPTSVLESGFVLVAGPGVA